MFQIIGLENLLAASAFIVLAIAILFPVEKWIEKALEISLKKHILILIGFLPFLVVGAGSGFIGLIYLFLGLVISWAFLFAFNVDRKYLYALALIFLGFTPFFLIIRMEQIAEYFAVLCYLSLVLGVFKDIFYEKIFTE